MSDQNTGQSESTQKVLKTAFSKKKHHTPDPAVPPPEKPAPAPDAVIERSKTADRTVVDLGPQNVGVYLPQGLLGRLKRERIRRSLTYTDLLVEAFDAVSEDELRASFGMVPVAGDGSAMPRRPQRRRTGGGVQIQLRLDDRQLAWLDGKERQVQAPSRSALVSAVLDMAIPGQ